MLLPLQVRVPKIEIVYFSRDTCESEVITIDKTPLGTAVEDTCF